MAGDHRDPWLGVELRHLSALSAIASEGTFSEAALSLGYVQSAISGQVAMLERLTGVRLVERSRGAGPKRLTEAGELLLGHSQEILAELESARRSLALGEEAGVPALRVAVSRDLAGGMAGTLLSSALSNAPTVEVASIDTLGCEQLVDALAREQVDVALVGLPLEHPAIATAELSREPMVVAVQADSPLARRNRPPTLEELCRLPLVVWHEGQNPSRLELELAGRELQPTVIAQTTSAEAATTLVAQGFGAALLPRGTIAANARIVALELDESILARVTGLAWLRARCANPQLRRFIDAVCRVRSGAQSNSAE